MIFLLETEYSVVVVVVMEVSAVGELLNITSLMGRKEKRKQEFHQENNYMKSPHPGRFKEKGDITREREDRTPI